MRHSCGQRLISDGSATENDSLFWLQTDNFDRLLCSAETTTIHTCVDAGTSVGCRCGPGEHAVVQPRRLHHGGLPGTEVGFRVEGRDEWRVRALRVQLVGP